MFICYQLQHRVFSLAKQYRFYLQWYSFILFLSSVSPSRLSVMIPSSELIL